MSDIIPIFYDSSSYKGILTWAEQKEWKDTGPTSIIKLAKEAGLKQIFYVSNSFYNYVEALKACDKNGLQMIFGLELLMCPNRKDHSEESTKQNHKVIVFGKNSQSYFDLIKLYSFYRTDAEAKYYKYRCDDEILNQFWTNNLILTLPFFDSFLAANLLTHGANVFPKFPTQDIRIFREQNTEHPHELLINDALDRFCKDKDYKQIKTKTIFYDKYDDIDAYIVYRGIHERTSWHQPEIPYLCSNTFCFEDYKKITA